MPCTRMPLLLALLAALMLGPAERAAAGTAIGESIWDRQNARERALQSVPAGAQILNSDCQTVEVGTGNFRYICRITYGDPAPQPQVPSR
jgi:hypothetical protein